MIKTFYKSIPIPKDWPFQKFQNMLKFTMSLPNGIVIQSLTNPSIGPVVPEIAIDFKDFFFL